MRKRFYALADFLLRWLSADGSRSYQIGRIRFLTAVDVRRIFPECIRDLGRDEIHSVPALETGKSAFLLEGSEINPDGFLRSCDLRLAAPFTALFQASDQRKLYVISGCLLVKDEKLGRYFICPESKSSRRVASAFRSVSLASAPSAVGISSWKSCSFGDFGLIMLPKLARIAGLSQKGGLLLPETPPYAIQYLQLFQLQPLLPDANPTQLVPVKDSVEIVFGPGVEEGFIPLQSDIEKLREQMVPLLANADHKRRLYLRRAGRRKIVNEEELLPLLEGLGIEIVEDNHSDVLEQAALFRGADFIVAPHGALLGNLIYCRPGAVLVELLPGRYASNCYRKLCQLAGVHYHAVFCTKLTNFQDDAVFEDFSIDTMKVRDVIEAILSQCSTVND
jgi:hypothetical protein